MFALFSIDLSGDTAIDMAAPGAMDGVAVVYALDYYSGIGGICYSLPEWLAQGMAKVAARFFNDFVFLHYLRD